MPYLLVQLRPVLFSVAIQCHMQPRLCATKNSVSIILTRAQAEGCRNWCACCAHTTEESSTESSKENSKGKVQKRIKTSQFDVACSSTQMINADAHTYVYMYVCACACVYIYRQIVPNREYQNIAEHTSAATVLPMFTTTHAHTWLANAVQI
jgi:hypothetical protein